ncbi:unnamed protein product [Ostreobium quekettii]|uniref:NADAR domain-containing protein n=1 Tax=Ostreobium quekettii TaxID=121088 RepID=A0A8S1JI87_9CHLO|nr:unnamed protein product [Ostreobium quekettii]|eukprot:evm.model.scf_141.2 EVM.evm.TU.scf_141.2   scf_141:72463-74957(-)
MSKRAGGSKGRRGASALLRGCVHKGCVYFWSSVPKNYPEDCPYYVFSQWYPAHFMDPEDGQAYSSAEQYMMAGKAKLFGDSEALEKIVETTQPRAVKALGRSVRGFDEATWDQNKYDIVVRGTRLKFSQNEELMNILLSTGDLAIAEAAPNDRVWGIGLGPEKALATTSRSEWRGSNLLGKALVQVRDELKEEGPSPQSEASSAKPCGDAE